jgi:hypothetical protein
MLNKKLVGADIVVVAVVAVVVADGLRPRNTAEATAGTPPAL